MFDDGVCSACTVAPATELDDVERNVEKLRKDAQSLVKRRDKLLSRLEGIVSQSEGVETESADNADRLANAQRLKTRCLEVEIKFATLRTEGQERALGEVNSLLEQLEQLGRDDPQGWSSIRHGFREC